MNNNDRKPATRTPAPNRTLDSYFPSRFLKVADLLAWKATEITPTIARVAEEEVQPEPNDEKEWKLVLYFAAKTGGEVGKGYLVSSKADKEALKAATGATTALDLVGQRVRVHIDTWRKKSVLRIDPAPIPATSPAHTEQSAAQSKDARAADKAALYGDVQGEREDYAPRCEHGQPANGCEVPGCPHHF